MTAGKSDESNDDRILGGSGRARSAEIAWRRGMARDASRQRIRAATARPNGVTPLSGLEIDISRLAVV